MVEIGLMREEAVPVVLAGDRIPGPVRFLGVGEDDPGLGKLPVGVAPDVEVALGRFGRGVTGALEPRVLVRGVVDDQLNQDLEAARVRRLDEGAEVIERPVTRVDVPVVGDVVAVVLER